MLKQVRFRVELLIRHRPKRRTESVDRVLVLESEPVERLPERHVRDRPVELTRGGEDVAARRREISSLVEDRDDLARHRNDVVCACLRLLSRDRPERCGRVALRPLGSLELPGAQRYVRRQAECQADCRRTYVELERAEDRRQSDIEAERKAALQRAAAAMEAESAASRGAAAALSAEMATARELREGLMAARAEVARLKEDAAITARAAELQAIQTAATAEAVAATEAAAARARAAAGATGSPAS